jgi:flagellar basal body rod protein FlgG
MSDPINGLTRAAHALRYWERRQEVVSNNLANANTTGFKAERVFGQLMGGALTVANTATDRSAGALAQTNAPLDLALGGEGFFVVETPAGERLTRGGSFSLDPEGRIADAAGNLLLGEGGPITVPQGELTIDADGVMRVNRAEIGRLRVEMVPAGETLQHEGGTLFVPGATRQPAEAGARQVKQGYLEDSNVNTIGTLVDLISIQRAYSAVQKAVTTLDGVRGTIANELAKS